MHVSSVSQKSTDMFQAPNSQDTAAHLHPKLQAATARRDDATLIQHMAEVHDFGKCSSDLCSVVLLDSKEATNKRSWALLLLLPLLLLI